MKRLGDQAIDFEFLVENARDAVICATLDDRVVYANKAAEAMLGFAPGGLAGLPLESLIPDRFRSAHQEGMKRYRATRVSVLVGNVVTVAARRADGSEVPIELSLSAPFGARSDLMVAVLRDLSKRKRLEEPPLGTSAEAGLDQSRQLALSRLRVLAEMGRLLASAPILEDALQRTAQAAAEALGDWSIVYRLIPGGKELQVVAAYHRDPERRADIDRIASGPGSIRRLGDGSGIAEVAETGKPLLLSPLPEKRKNAFAGSPDRRAAAMRLGARSAVEVPLQTASGIYGVLAVVAGDGLPPLGDDDLAFAGQLADRAAASLVREDLLSQIAEERARLAQILDRLPVAVVVRNAGGEVLANTAARRLVSDPFWPRSQQTPFSSLLLDAEGRAFPEDELPLVRVLRDGRPIERLECSLLRADGTRVSVVLDAAAIGGAGDDELAVAAFQDVTALREAERRERILSEVSRTLLDSVGPDELQPLHRIVEQVGTGLGEWCVFSLIQPGGALRHVVAHHPDPAQRALSERLMALLPLQQWDVGPFGQALRSGEPILFDRVTPDMLMAYAGMGEALSMLGELRVMSTIIAPLRRGEELLGTLTLTSAGRGGRRYGEADVDFARALADRAAVAVHNARLTRAAARDRDLLRASRDEAQAARGTVETILLHAPVGIAYIDRDLRFALVNETLAHLLERSASELLGRRVEEVAVGEEIAGLLAGLPKVWATGETLTRRELELPSPAGPGYFDAALFPIRNDAGLVLGVTAIVVDQTLQVRSRQRIAELATSEQRRAAELLAVFEADPSGLAVYGPDDRLRYASRRLEQLFGIALADLVGKHFRDVFSLFAAAGLREPERVLARTAEFFANRQLATTDEVAIERPEELYLRRTTRPVAALDGTYLGRLEVFLDVTHERELDRQRSEFLTVVSHELRTPLTPLAIQLQTIERKLARGQKVEPAAAAKARKQLARLNELIDDLLDFSRLESGRLELRRERLALEQLVADVVSDYRGITTIHEIHFEPPSQETPVDGDRLRLEQVLLNLLQNAVKYSPRGGEVRVKVETRGPDALVSVTDRGIGIPPEEHARLFERFFRARNATSRHFGGLGIGLHVSHEIVERHGGGFEVDSEPGRGSTFRFSLPLAGPAPVGEPASPRILLIDDDPAILDAVGALLEDEGYRVDRARSGEEALRLGRAHRPDLAMVDLMMPVMDGWKLVDQMRQERLAEGVPLVIMSADRNTHEKAKELGADGALSKPFDLEELLSTVRRFLACRRRPAAGRYL